MQIIKEGNSNWKNKEMAIECPFCSCYFKGTVKSGDFKVITDNPKFYNYETTCPSCGTKLKF